MSWWNSQTQRPTGIGWSLITVVIGCVLVAGSAAAVPPGAGSSSAENGDGGSCEYHTDCESGTFCFGGECQPVEDVVQTLSSASGDTSIETMANDECGGDRQCRIDRLRRKNRARRHVQKLEEEQQAEETIQRIQESKLEEMPRLDRPIGFDWRVSRLGALGVAAGYTFGGRLRGELQFARNWFSVNQTVDVQGNDISFNGSQPISFVLPGIYYYFLKSDFSPYLGATFVYGKGELSVGSSSLGSGGSDGEVSDNLGTEYHGIGLHGGLDFQWRGNGFHSRLGVAYRPKLYHQARISAGNYSELGRRVIDQWYQQVVRLDVVFLLGWNF